MHIFVINRSSKVGGTDNTAIEGHGELFGATIEVMGKEESQALPPEVVKMDKTKKARFTKVVLYF
jgi:hypothetical protein